MSKRNLIPIGLLIFAFTALFSCAKEKCKQCTVTTVQSFMGVNQTISAPTTSYCGDDYDLAPADEVLVNNIGGGVTQTITTSCTDN